MPFNYGENMLNIGIYKKFNNYLYKHYYFIFFWLIILLFLLVFTNISYVPINSWDEARHGISAYEMIKNNNYIANFYNGKIDYWNLKPPLSFYTIILGYKIFGFNELGLRFFSGLFYIITSIIISVYLKKKNCVSSLLSLIFMASLSYVFFMHLARSADADSLFLLLFTIAIISLVKTEKNERYLYLCGLMFSLMFLTKSFHSLFLVPIVFLYLLFTKGFIRIKWYRIIIFILISIIPILIWGLFRYMYDGFEFFKLMIDYDLLNRSNNAIEGHNEIFIFYLLIILASAPGLVILFTLFIIKKFIKKEKLNYEYICYLLSILIIFIIYTIAKSKLVWYIYPIFIPFVLLASISFSKLNINKLFIIFRKMSFILSLINIIISFIFVTIFSTYFDPIELKKYDGLQKFISNIEIKNIDLYIDYNNSKTFNQNDMLKAKLYLDANTLDGGFESFILDDNSYIILNKDSNYDISMYKIIYEYNNYILIYNE